MSLLLRRVAVAGIALAVILPEAVAVAESRVYSTRSPSRSAIEVAPEPRISRDPAVRRYWSNPCVQAREMGDRNRPGCDHPAYSGSAYPGSQWGGPPYGAPPIIVVPVPVVPYGGPWPYRPPVWGGR